MNGAATATSWMSDFDATTPEMRRRKALRRLVLVLDFALTVFVLYSVGDFVLNRLDSLDDLGPAVLDPPSWLGYAIVVVNAALMFGSLLFSVLPAQRHAVERDPSAAFTGEQRRQVWRKLRGREAVADGEMPLLRAAAGAAYARRWIAVFLLGIVLQNIWVALANSGPAPRVLIAAAFTFAMVLILRRAWSAKAFLQRTAAHA
jgi:hypothetical protein